MFRDFVFQCKSSHDGFCFSRKIITAKGVLSIDIYTGVWIGDCYSTPEHCPSLDNYSNLGLSIFEGSIADSSSKLDNLNLSDKLKKELLNYLDNPNNWANMLKVPISLVKELFQELGIFSSKEKVVQKTGGICKKCKSYDDYAVANSAGNFLCYKCFY